MIETLWAAVIVLSVVVAALVAAVLGLARQVGILYERIAPVGALILDAGPKVGEQAPSFDLIGLDGRRVELGRPAATSTLLFFLSPTCPVCKKLLPILKSTARSEASWLRIVLASDGERGAQEKFYRQAKLEEFPYLLSTELGLAYKVSRLPHAVLIDETGHVKAKGLVNSREQLESLFTAKELGVSSVQEYLKSA
ncbi:MAG TPA: methylamine dehydrogenase accessory protein MauD [Gammaproteobacteria bacterium]|nr:methylamine dehydrogenase accessory protein MauD [Gammaproteobacteria bacterium]